MPGSLCFAIAVNLVDLDRTVSIGKWTDAGIFLAQSSRTG